MSRKPKPARDPLAEFANRLTSEQAIRLYDIADPLSHLDRTEVDKLSDEELLEQLK